MATERPFHKWYRRNDYIYLHPRLLLTSYTPSAMRYRKAFTSRSERQGLESAVEETCLLPSIKICPSTYFEFLPHKIITRKCSHESVPGQNLLYLYLNLEIKFGPVVSKQNSSSVTSFFLTKYFFSVFHRVFNFLLAHTHYFFQCGKRRGRKSEERKHLLKIKGEKKIQHFED